jgi:hypothetical protein
MYGQFALNPAVAKINDRRERGKVVNAAWNAYNVINAVSLGSVAIGWFGSRLTETRPDRLTPEESKLALAKDGFTLAALAPGSRAPWRAPASRTKRRRVPSRSSAGPSRPRTRLRLQQRPSVRWPGWDS